jgi:hypothetical protein
MVITDLKPYLNSSITALIDTELVALRKSATGADFSSPSGHVSRKEMINSSFINAGYLTIYLKRGAREYSRRWFRLGPRGSDHPVLPRPTHDP